MQLRVHQKDKTTDKPEEYLPSHKKIEVKLKPINW